MVEHKGLTIRTRADFVGKESPIWKRIGIDIDPKLWRSFQDEAREAGCSASELVRAILSAWSDGVFQSEKENSLENSKDCKKK